MILNQINCSLRTPALVYYNLIPSMFIFTVSLLRCLTGSTGALFATSVNSSSKFYYRRKKIEINFSRWQSKLSKRICIILRASRPIGACSVTLVSLPYVTRSMQHLFSRRFSSIAANSSTSLLLFSRYRALFGPIRFFAGQHFTFLLVQREPRLRSRNCCTSRFVNRAPIGFCSIPGYFSSDASYSNAVQEAGRPERGDCTLSPRESRHRVGLASSCSCAPRRQSSFVDSGLPPREARPRTF